MNPDACWWKKVIRMQAVTTVYYGLGLRISYVISDREALLTSAVSRCSVTSTVLWCVQIREYYLSGLGRLSSEQSGLP